VLLLLLFFSLLSDDDGFLKKLDGWMGGIYAFENMEEEVPFLLLLLLRLLQL
jgi:hypothetical protein